MDIGSIPVCGGISAPHQPDDSSSQAAAKAVEVLNSDSALLSSSLGPNVVSLSLVAIKSVRTQVVAGMNYYLTLEVKDAQGNSFDIDVVAWSQPWLAAQNAKEAFQLTSVRRSSA